MTATITTPDQFRHRREVKNLEAAVRRANSERNNVVMIGTNAYDRSDYFFARAPEEQRFKDVPLEKSAPLKTWLTDIFAGAKVIIGVVILWGIADLVAKAVL